QGDVGDGVLNHESGAGFAVGDLAPRAAVDLDRAELLFRDLVAPVTEGAFRELHDVALMNQRDALAFVVDGVADGAVNQPLAAEPAHWFQADADLNGRFTAGRANRLELRLPGASRRLGAEADLPEVFREFLFDKVEDLLRLGRPRDIFNPGVDVLDVLAEDHHVDLLGMPDGRRHAAIPAHGTQTHEQIEQLAQRDVERPDAAAHGRRQRALDADQVFAKRFDGLVRQPVVRQLEALLAGQHFHPRDLLFSAVRFLDGGVHHAHARAPDVGTSAVTFDERNDRIVGN